VARKFFPRMTLRTFRLLTIYAAYCQQLRCRDVKGLGGWNVVMIKGQKPATWGCGLTCHDGSVLLELEEEKDELRPQKGPGWIGRLCISVLRRDTGFIPSA
jgi:hypothetical protein